MYSELVFACGCVYKGKSTSNRCKQHKTGVIAQTATNRKRQSYSPTDKNIIAELEPFVGSPCELFYKAFAANKVKAFRYQILIVPNDFEHPIYPNMVRMRDITAGLIKGHDVAVAKLSSLKALGYFMKHTNALYVHTESPLIFRAIKCPDIINTMSFCGSGKFNGKKKKAA